MCGYKTLYKNASGYVICCKGCGGLQVAFGTVMLSFTDEQFHNFISVVGKLHTKNKNAATRDQKTIQVPTAAQSVSLVFTANELDKLFHLLIQGRNKIAHEKLFAYNEN